MDSAMHRDPLRLPPSSSNLRALLVGIHLHQQLFISFLLPKLPMRIPSPHRVRLEGHRHRHHLLILPYILIRRKNRGRGRNPPLEPLFRNSLLPARDPLRPTPAPPPAGTAKGMAEEIPPKLHAHQPGIHHPRDRLRDGDAHRRHGR